MEHIELVLSLAGAAIGLLLTTVTLVAKLTKNTKVKKAAENTVDICNVLLSYICEAENYLNFSGAEKKKYVMTKTNKYAADNDMTFDENFVSQKVEELVGFSKEVNAKVPENMSTIAACSAIASTQNNADTCTPLQEATENTETGVGSIYIGNAPANLVEDSRARREKRIKLLRAKATEQTRLANFKYYCSVCLIIRDENEYLGEWLQWHIGQGVQHFYIYDHGSKQPVKEFVDELGENIANKVTVINWGKPHVDAQRDAYNDCLNRYRGESRWIGFIDADEQVRVKNGHTLSAFLKNYEDYAGLFVVWLVYGADGQIKQEDGPLRERFKQISRADKWANRTGKVFVQPFFMSDMSIHNGGAKGGFEIVDEHKRKVSNYSMNDVYATTDLICIDHYYTKSYEEWLKKIRRGSGDARYRRKYAEFFRCNPDMEYCRENLELRQKYEDFDK